MSNLKDKKKTKYNILEMEKYQVTCFQMITRCVPTKQMSYFMVLKKACMDRNSELTYCVGINVRD